MHTNRSWQLTVLAHGNVSAKMQTTTLAWTHPPKYLGVWCSELPKRLCKYALCYWRCCLMLITWLTSFNIADVALNCPRLCNFADVIVGAASFCSNGFASFLASLQMLLQLTQQGFANLLSWLLLHVNQIALPELEALANVLSGCKCCFTLLKWLHKLLPCLQMFVQLTKSPCKPAFVIVHEEHQSNVTLSVLYFITSVLLHSGHMAPQASVLHCRCCAILPKRSPGVHHRFNAEWCAPCSLQLDQQPWGCHSEQHQCRRQSSSCCFEHGVHCVDVTFFGVTHSHQHAHRSETRLDFASIIIIIM